MATVSCFQRWKTFQKEVSAIVYMVDYHLAHKLHRTHKSQDLLFFLLLFKKMVEGKRREGRSGMFQWDRQKELFCLLTHWDFKFNHFKIMTSLSCHGSVFSLWMGSSTDKNSKHWTVIGNLYSIFTHLIHSQFGSDPLLLCSWKLGSLKHGYVW